MSCRFSFFVELYRKNGDPDTYSVRHRALRLSPRLVVFPSLTPPRFFICSIMKTMGIRLVVSCASVRLVVFVVKFVFSHSRSLSNLCSRSPICLTTFSAGELVDSTEIGLHRLCETLVLIMEDLQHADPCSLDLLCSLISDDQNQGLLVIGTVDSSAVPGDSVRLHLLWERRGGGGWT